MSITRHSPRVRSSASSRAVSSNLSEVKQPRTFYFKCDMPPTANHMHTVARVRKIKSAEYRAWLDATGYELYAQAGHPIYVDRLDKPVSVSINIPKRHALSDLDNRIKPILDALQKSGVVINDNQV